MVGYSPLGRGFLTGQIKSRDDIPEGDFRLHLDRLSEEVRARVLIYNRSAEPSTGIQAQFQGR